MAETNRQKWERYIHNLRRVRTLSHPQFPPETAPEVLLEAIQGNAVRCFDRMKENNALLGELVYTRDAKTLSDDDIAELEEAAGRLFNYANSEDCGVAYKIHELLLKAARFRDDVPMIVRELYYNGITLHYINVRDEDHDVNLLWPRIHAFFLEGANYIARYEELDKETRQYIIRCVGNIRMAVSRRTKENCRRYQELFETALRIIESPYYQEMDPDIPWQRYIYAMHMDQMTELAYLRENDDPMVAERVLRSATYVYEHQSANRGEEYKLPNDATAMSVSCFPDVLSVEKKEADAEAISAGICAVAEQALCDFDAMRLREGEKLRDDVTEKLASIDALVTKIEKESPKTVAEYRARLEARMAEVLGTAGIEESRILAEAAVFADHVAVDEETVRLRSHLSQMEALLSGGGPIGRKLDFLLQEFNREANTIGSKCQSSDIAHVVVDLKSEIEKIREQIQNIE